MLLFLPKLNLIHFDNETAGIRLDDLILALFCFFVISAWFYQNKSCDRPELYLAGVICCSCISFLLNQLFTTEGILVVKAKIFYIFRIFEYFLFFYIGLQLAKTYSIKKILIAFVIVNTLLMWLQKEGVVARLTSLGENVIDTVRVSGVASFPSEMGAILSMIFAYFLSQSAQKNHTISRACILLLFYFPLTLLTGARIAVATLIILFFVFLFRNLRLSQFLLLTILISAGLGLPFYYLIESNEGVSSRSSSLLSLENLEMVSAIWNSIDVHSPLYDNIPMVDPLYDIGATEIDYDLSWWIRIHKWCYALKVFLQQPFCYLFGVGPGALSAALDGGFLRIVTEHGLIGSAFYYAFFRELAKISSAMRWVLFAFLLNMIFFDVYLAYKAMSIFFLIAGWERGLSKEHSNIPFIPDSSKA